jgi:ABC-type multidrug transport system permease subunit
MSPGWRHNLEVIRALVTRSRNELLRVPGAAIPGVLAPTIFFLGLNGVFGNLVELRGFATDSYLSFIIPVSMLQGAGFTGAATGVNLARDIEQGWFDRLLAAPVPRWVLLTGLVASASLRALIPVALLLLVAIPLGAQWPGLLGLLLAAVLVMGMAAVAACWGTTLALKYRTQQAAPLMQAGTFILILFTPAYAPLPLLADWLGDIARVNPVSDVIEAVRQPFIGEVTWAETWPGLVAIAALLVLLGALSLRGMRRTAV